MRRAGVAALAVLALCASVSSARADVTASCEVVEIVATKTDAPSIDPQLGPALARKLARGLAGFNTFSMSARLVRELTALEAEVFDLPRGLAALVLRKKAERPGRRKVVFHLGIALEDGNGKRYVETRTRNEAGQYVMFGRTVTEGEGVVTAIGCQ